jgi:hypothetical protein
MEKIIAISSQEFITKYVELMKIQNRIERDRAIWSFQTPYVSLHGLAHVSKLVREARALASA